MNEPLGTQPDSLILAEEAREILVGLSEQSWSPNTALQAAQVNALLAVWAELKRANDDRPNPYRSETT
jgi:hypothetical protein